MNYEFHIYTATPQFVKEFANKSNGKIKVNAPIKREQLLTTLSAMDFVVNFENVGSKQTPSKLIDYAIIDKPILSIKTGELNENLVNQFLSKNYAGSLQIENINKYKIENVVNLFIEILE
jgi:bifunctional ADP-heptose synthase (sugar kinase/adenylyltransferase)